MGQVKTDTAADQGHRSPYWVSGEAAAAVKTKHRPARKRRAMSLAARLAEEPLVTARRHPARPHQLCYPHADL